MFLLKGMEIDFTLWGGLSPRLRRRNGERNRSNEMGGCRNGEKRRRSMTKVGGMREEENMEKLPFKWREKRDAKSRAVHIHWAWWRLAMMKLKQTYLVLFFPSADFSLSPFIFPTLAATQRDSGCGNALSCLDTICICVHGCVCVCAWVCVCVCAWVCV